MGAILQPRIICHWNVHQHDHEEEAAPSTEAEARTGGPTAATRQLLRTIEEGLSEQCCSVSTVGLSIDFDRLYCACLLLLAQALLSSLCTWLQLDFSSQPRTQIKSILYKLSYFKALKEKRRGFQWRLTVPDGSRPINRTVLTRDCSSPPAVFDRRVPYGNAFNPVNNPIVLGTNGVHLIKLRECPKRH